MAAAAAAAAAATLGTGSTAFAADSACSGPGYLAAIDADAPPPAPLPGRGTPVLKGPAQRIYEGEPWRSLAVSRWDCIEEAIEAVPKDAAPGPTGLPAFAVFPPSANVRKPIADRVPAGCTRTAYMIGRPKVRDPKQYAVYSQGLSTTAGASHAGMVMVFGGNKPVATSRGTWPADTQFILTQWPCAESFERWFLGEEYQTRVLPLRKDAADYRLGRFEPLDIQP